MGRFLQLYEPYFLILCNRACPSIFHRRIVKDLLQKSSAIDLRKNCKLHIEEAANLFDLISQIRHSYNQSWLIMLHVLRLAHEPIAFTMFPV